MIYQRYIAKEILKPAGAIFIVIVIIFTANCAITYLAQAIGGSLPPNTVGMLIMLRLGMSMEILLPTTFYLAIIVALGRLYMDNEMTAFSACGLGISSVLKLVLTLSLPVALMAAFASLYIRPEAYEKIYQVMDQAQTDFDISRLNPNTFLEIQDGKVVFFAVDVQTNNTAKNVFVRKFDRENRQLIISQQMTQTEKDGNRILNFQDGMLYEFPHDTELGKVSQFKDAQYPLSQNDQGNSHYRRKSASTEQLIGSSQLEDIAELQWRLSTPISTILLALIGVPLSKSNPRKGKYAKIAIGIVIFAIYYQLFVIARTWVEKGKIPPVIGIWWVPFLLIGLSIFLLWRTHEVFYRTNK